MGVKYIIPRLMENVDMADRELKAVISKESKSQLKEAIDKIDETEATIKGLEITETNDGASVLKILLEV